MHIVHYNLTTGDLAVLGVFFDEGEDNEFISSMELGSGGNATNVTLMSFLDAFWDGGEFYQYEGSLTTPPCTEVVTFNILTDIQ